MTRTATKVPHYTEDPEWEWKPGSTLHVLTGMELANATGKPEDLPMPDDMRDLKLRVAVPGEPRLAVPNRMRDLLFYPPLREVPSFASFIVPALIVRPSQPETYQELWGQPKWENLEFTREYQAEVPDEWLPPESTATMGCHVQASACEICANPGSVLAQIEALEVEHFEAEDRRIHALLESTHSSKPQTKPTTT